MTLPMIDEAKDPGLVIFMAYLAGLTTGCWLTFYIAKLI